MVNWPLTTICDTRATNHTAIWIIMAKLHFPTAFIVPAITLAAASLGACSAQGYGHGSSYAANCNTALAAAACARYGQSAHNQRGYGEYSTASYGAQPVRKTRYGTAYQTASYNTQYYAQPQMMLRPAPYVPPVQSYQTASTSYQQPALNVEMYNQPSVTANCPAGTTAQSDGTCLQGGSVSSYTSSYSPSYVTSGGSVENCPAGTTSQSDGTCLQGGSISSYSSPSYTGPTYSASSSLDTAPALSTYDFGNYNWGSKDTTWGSDSYVSPGSRIVDGPNHYPSTSETPTYGYMPSRK